MPPVKETKRFVVVPSDQVIVVAIGAVLTCAGLIFLVVAIEETFHPYVQDGSFREHFLPANVCSLIAAAFIGFGAPICLIKDRTIIDAVAKCCKKQSGWGPWSKTTSTDMRSATHIIIGPEELRPGRMTQHSHSVIPISWSDGDAVEEIFAPRTLFKARRFCKQLSDAVQLPVIDRTENVIAEGEISASGAFDQAWADKQAGDTAAPIRSEGCRIMVSTQGEGMTVRIPMPESSGKALRSMAVYFVVASAFLLCWNHVQAFRHGQQPSFKGSSPEIIFFAAILSIQLLIAATRGFFGITLHLDPVQGLRFWKGRIPAQSLHAITLKNGEQCSLRIVTDSSEFTLAEGQSREELLYIRALIRYRLRSRAPSS